MALSLDQPVTWRSIIRIGLLWAAEYALLSLIEDAPVALKVATIFCALGALGVLEAEDWIIAKHRVLLAAMIGALVIIYLSFIGYALDRALVIANERNGLEKIYAQSGRLLNPEISGPAGTDAYNKAVKKWTITVNKWEHNSADWITQNLGEVARDRFLDMSGYLNLSDSAQSREYNEAMRDLFKDRKNLSIMIESGAYYR